MARRAGVLTAVIALAFFILIGRLAYLQLYEGQRWEEAAVGQRIRLVSIPAPRGRILDRAGRVLATNIPVYTASLVYTGEPMPEASVKLLSQILGIKEEDIKEAEKQLQPAYGRPYEPVPLRVITDEQHTLLEEHRHELPGVVVEALPMRFYPGLEGFEEIGSRLAAHVIGQVKRADRGSALQGADGIELSYNGNPEEAERVEDLGLQGQDGLRQIEVDAQGRPVRLYREKSPVPGNDVILTIDARLQAVAEKALMDRMTYLRQLRSKDCPSGCAAEYGAAVVIDVRTGEILVMASIPSFDPYDFAKRAPNTPGTGSSEFSSKWAQMQSDPGRPLLNHATLDAAPPGSTFKPVTALAALEANVTNPRERVVCPGFKQVGNIRFGDWGIHGVVNLEQALARSCDVYFYELASRMKIQTLVNMAAQFGFGEKTGLEDRNGIKEIAGWVASPETKRKRNKQDPTWYKAQNLNWAIGQDDNQFTPLQMANFAAALASGVRYKPYVVKAIASSNGKVLKEFGPEVAAKLKAKPENLEAVRRGMLAVTQFNQGWSGPDSPYGTAYGAFGDFAQKSMQLLGREIRVAGKTGTAETGRKGETPYAWFIAYAPYDKPEIAVAVYVRHGGGGSLAAAPVARAIMDEYFGLNRAQAPAQPALQKKTGQVVF